MQNPESKTYHCPKCGAQPGADCLTIDGRVAAKVHYGRPERPPHLMRAWDEAVRILATSPLRPTPQRTGIWVGSVRAGRGQEVPYGVWHCPCGENFEALSLEGVVKINELYAAHAGCRG